MEMPEYMKVRSYLYGLAQHAAKVGMRIPSENELCRIFGVSRITVRGAIRGLVEARVLVSRRGVGTFVNPEHTGAGTMLRSVIGLMENFGRNVYFSVSQAIRGSVLESGMDTEYVVLPDSDDPSRLMEMISGSIDGIIWSDPKSQILPCMKALKANGIPLLCITDREKGIPELSGFDTVFTSSTGRGRMLANYLFGKGFSKVMYVHNYAAVRKEVDSPENPETTSGAVSARLTELAGDSAECRMCSILELQKKPELLNGFGCVYSGRELAPHLGMWFAERGIRVPEDISYLAYNPAASRFFGGKPVTYLSDAAAVHDFVSEWLDLRILHRDYGGLFQKGAEADVHEGKTVKPTHGPESVRKIQKIKYGRRAEDRKAQNVLLRPSKT